MGEAVGAAPTEGCLEKGRRGERRGREAECDGLASRLAGVFPGPTECVGGDGVERAGAVRPGAAGARYQAALLRSAWGGPQGKA